MLYHQVSKETDDGRFLVFYQVAGMVARTVVADCATHQQATDEAKRLNDDGRARDKKMAEERARADFYRIRFKNDRGGR